MVNTTFSFQDLQVWQKAVDFAERVILLVDQMETDRKHYRLIEQLESCSTSVAMNIAEGKGRYSQKEFIHFLYIARGSLFETITLLEIFKRMKWITEKHYCDIELQGEEIAKMLNSLISKLKKSS
jgi:four helix bundle protein